MTENVLRWDCVCDACDSTGRYHAISDQGRLPTPKRPGPNYLGLLLIVIVGVLLELYRRSMG